MGCALDFDPNDYDRGRPVYPEGRYLVVMEKNEKKETKGGNGAGLNCELKIVEGQHNGKPFFIWLNLWHASEQARNIGRAELKEICHAVGKPQLRDTAELCGIPFYIDVRCKGNGPDMENVIKGYAPRHGGRPPATHHNPQPAQPQEGYNQAGHNPGSAPW